MLERYTLPAMAQLWGEENKFQKWLEVELANLKARNTYGELSAEVYHAIKSKAGFDIKRINELEAIYHHDMIAFVTCVQEHLEEAGAGKYKGEFHKGLTSYDIEDPATILSLTESATLIRATLVDFREALFTKSNEHKLTLMIARTHAQFAEPTTFGLLLRVFLEQTERNIDRLDWVVKHELSEGKMSGAVGSYGGMNPLFEDRALHYLRLRSAYCETQILQRDRHASFLSVLGIIASCIEQMMRTLHVMTHSCVGELKEGKAPKQRGSSSMAHKENSVKIEQLFGLPRLLRANAGVAMENIATLEHRDISQSSVERHIFPESTALVHYMLVTAKLIIQQLVVDSERMKRNLMVESRGVWAGQQIRNALMAAGVDYDTAYLYVQKCAFTAKNSGRHLRYILAKRKLSKINPRTAVQIIGDKKLERFFEPMPYIQKGVEHIYGKRKY